MLVSKFESIKEAKGLIHGSPHRKVVDGLLAQNTFWGDDEQATQGNTSVVALFNKHLVVFRDGFGDVRDKGVAKATQTALVARSVDPVQMREHRID